MEPLKIRLCFEACDIHTYFENPYLDFHKNWYAIGFYPSNQHFPISRWRLFELCLIIKLFIGTCITLSELFFIHNSHTYKI